MSLLAAHFFPCSGCGRRADTWHTGARWMCRQCWRDTFGPDTTRKATGGR